MHKESSTISPRILPLEGKWHPRGTRRRRAATGLRAVAIVSASFGWPSRWSAAPACPISLTPAYFGWPLSGRCCSWPMSSSTFTWASPCCRAAVCSASSAWSSLPTSWAGALPTCPTSTCRPSSACCSPASLSATPTGWLTRRLDGRWIETFLGSRQGLSDISFRKFWKWLADKTELRNSSNSAFLFYRVYYYNGCWTFQ